MLEYWFRERAWIEERPKDAKLGYGLIHLPSGKFRVNQAWMWSAYLATNLSSFTQTLGRVDLDGVRSHAKRARRELFCLPARVLSHARAVIVRFAAGVADTAFRTAFENLRALPSAPGRLTPQPDPATATSPPRPQPADRPRPLTTPAPTPTPNPNTIATRRHRPDGAPSTLPCGSRSDQGLWCRGVRGILRRRVRNRLVLARGMVAEARQARERRVTLRI